MKCDGDLCERTRHVLTALMVATVAARKDVTRKHSSRCSFGTSALGKRRTRTYMCVAIKTMHVYLLFPNAHFLFPRWRHAWVRFDLSLHARRTRNERAQP